ncbi:MAG: hypothetical protein QM803_06700 [Rhodocyclaceae bacterium]
MSTTQLDFTVTEGELSVPQLVSAVFANTPIGYLKLSPPPGVTATTWLTTELYQTSSAAWVYADARALKAGTYCTAVRVETLDSTGTKTLSFLDVGAKVTVSPKSSSSSSASADLEWGVYAGGAKPTGTASISYPTLKGMFYVLPRKGDDRQLARPRRIVLRWIQGRWCDGLASC